MKSSYPEFSPLSGSSSSILRHSGDKPIGSQTEVDMYCKKKQYPAYFYPYWIDICYMHNVKIYESHAESIINNSGNNKNDPWPLYKIFKEGPLTDYQPHSSYDFMKSIEELENQLTAKKKEHKVK